MLRRGRNGRTRHLAWSEIRQETDAMEVIQTLDREQWEGQTTTQISDLESDVDYLASSQTVTEVVALPCTVPVIGESFCQCDRQEELSPGYILISDCVCGEEDQGEQKLTNTVIQYMNTAGYSIKCGVEAAQTNITI
ncbi:SPRY domain-containing SOCS box protein 3-like isoform X2 [Seriola lalandi dorsalis]|nr:SPRY domain-containing SOCS box protein 3-like isoform X2 [Seriola lalandi dorsalis]